MRGTEKLQHYSGLLFAGAIFPLGLAPFNLWPAVLISIALLFRSLQHKTIKKTLLNTTAYAFGLFFAGASWLYVSIHEYGFIAAPLALLATILFCLFLACIFAIPFALSALIPQTPISWIFALPSIWILSEWVRTWFLTGFPWLFAGYSHTGTWLSGWAPVGGVLWLSFLSAFSGILLALICQGRIKVSVVRQSTVVMLCVVFAGYILQQYQWTEESGKPLSVTLIQPNIPQSGKWSEEKQTAILTQLSAQTEGHWDKDLIIWPEMAVPTIPERIPVFMQDLQKRALKTNTSLLSGIVIYDNETRRYFNSMIAMGPSTGQYNKTRLVPFGEYVPFESMLRGLIKFFDLPMSSIALGAVNQHPFSVHGHLISAAICYEVVYPDLVARNSIDSAIIMTVSNDTWFGRSIGPKQHMQMAQMRALENAKPLMRGTNNGISALVDHKGRIYQLAEQHKIAALSGIVQPRIGATIFSKLRSWPIIFIALLICIVLVRARKQH